MENQTIFSLSNKKALVTGAGHGLGRAFSEAMAEFGADVACADREVKTAQETSVLISRFGHRAIHIEADVSKPGDVERMVNEAVSKLGTIDILINNAGVTGAPMRISDTPIEDWDRIIAVDLRGVFLCMRAVLPIMLKQKKGSIINISSVGAFGCSMPVVAPAAYAVSKAGVNLLTKHGAIEYARDGIRINSIAPGFHDTGFGGKSSPDGQARTERLLNNVPMGRSATPNEIKGLAVYLASDASSFVTGQVFIEDGGQLAKI